MIALLKCLIAISIIGRSCSLNVLFISDPAAGHITTVFELAKAMKHHNVTFLTSQLARNYVKFETSSRFQLIYTNDSDEAIIHEKRIEEETIALYANYSFIDSMIHSMPRMIPYALSVLNKTMDILTKQRYDVIISSALVLGIPILCDAVKTPCVLQGPVSLPNVLDFNLPNYFSLLTPADMRKTSNRLFNAIFTFRLVLSSLIKMMPVAYQGYHLLPRVPGPFHETFTLKNLLSRKSETLNLVSMPSTFYASTVEDAYTKYLGAFIDDTPVAINENDLTRWFQSKSTKTVVFGAFGSTSLIPHQRMLHLIMGIGAFLMNTPQSFICLAFRSANYEVYEAVLNEINDEKLTQLFRTSERVRIEQGFVPQKWILQQGSVKVFLSHCGMGSLMEALYYEKTILCLPFNMDQFSNAVTIEHRGVGLSLFVPNLSPWQSLFTPYDYRHYTFTPKDVERKLSLLWSNATYEQAANQLSLEMKRSGGVARAVKEIEFFVQLNGSFDRFVPFQSTLPFYQRYLLDIIGVFVIVPGIIIHLGVSKCRRKQRKDKID